MIRPDRWIRVFLVGASLLLPAPAFPVEALEGEQAPADGGSGWTGRDDDARMTRSALEVLREVENLSIRFLPQGAVLEGSLLTGEDRLRVKRVAASIPGVLDLCRLDPEALELGAAHLRREMARMEIAGLEVRPTGELLLLTGSPSSPHETAQLRKVADALGLPLVDGTRPDPGTRMVTFEVCFTEVNRQAFRDLGISWPSSLTFQDPSGARFDRLGLAQSLQVAVNLMVQRGEGKILSRPLLVCRSGESASFLAGGEIPIPQRTKEGDITVLWKNYGIILEISPVVDRKGAISARINTEISMIDRANAVEGIPGILSRRVGTGLCLAEGQTVVLSGLVNTEDASTVKEVPILSSLPVLGELFRSRGFQRRETELVVFLTPSFTMPEKAPGAGLIRNTP